MIDTYGTRLATLDPETGKPPSSRLGNAGNARTLVNRLKYEDDTRMYRYTKVQGLLDGNPPWPQQRLVDLGQGHRANFNLREGEGIVDSAKTPYYDLVFEVPTFARITFDVPGVQPWTLDNWGNWASAEYYETLCAWTGFDQNIQTHQWQMIVNGVGPMFWPHSVSWYSEATKCRKVLVPQETKANVEQLELCVVLHSFRADELYRYIEKGAGNDENYNGWNVPLCTQAIIDSAHQEMRNAWGRENFDLFQRAIRTGDIFYGIQRSSRIYVASVFVREFGGKVSHYILTDIPLGNARESYEFPEDEKGYLYVKKNKYEGFDQVIDPFFFDTAPDGTWHAVKGLGPKIFDFCDVSNRTFCQMLDGSVIGSGIVLEAQDGAALEETQMALVGGGTVVSPGYKVVQSRIAESLQGAMTMRRELQNVLQSNTGSYRQRPTEERDEPTLGQAQLNYQQQALLSKGATNRYYNNLDKFHTETVRRLLDPDQSNDVPGGREAKEFVARLAMRGIPKEILKMRFIRKVRSTRSLGYGSPQLRDMATKEVIQMTPAMDEVSRNHAFRMRASALPGIGPEQVDSLFPPIENQKIPNDHTWAATEENNALRTENGKVIITPSQNHSIHFDTHMADVQAHKQEPGNPMQLLIHMEQAGGHMQQHLARIANDPTRKDEIKQKSQALAQLSKETDQLQQQVQEQMKSQQGGNGQGPDPATLKAQGELALKAKQTQAEIQRKNMTAQAGIQLKDKKTGADIRRRDMEAAAKMRRTGAQSIADMLRADSEAQGSQAREDFTHRHDVNRSALEFAVEQRREDQAHAAEQQRKDAESAAAVEAMQQEPEQTEEPTQ